MFRDREHAGHSLAERLRGEPLNDPLVLAIPRGGVIVGAEVARALGAELDVVLVSRLCSPGLCGSEGSRPVGAVSEDGAEHLIPGAVQAAGLAPEDLSRERRWQAEQLARRWELYRRIRPASRTSGRSVIVVDDGVVSGATLMAALESVRSRGAAEVIAAAPVMPKNVFGEVARRCSRVVSVLSPDECPSLERHYAKFDPVDEEAVLDRLRDSVGSFVPGSAGRSALSWAG